MELQEKLTIGRICEIIALDIGTSSAQGLVTLELFNVGSELHPAFNLPVLSRPPDGPTHMVISAQVRLIIHNLLLKYSDSEILVNPICVLSTT